MEPAAVRLLSLLLFVLFACWALESRGQQHHHPLHHDYYRHWKQPGTNVSCCDARIEKDGVERGDCEPTIAEMRKGDWYFYVRQINQWVKIDDSKIIRERNPSGQQAHICWTPYLGVICAVPPDTGG